MELEEGNHCRVGAWVQHKPGDTLPVPIESRYHKGEEEWVWSQNEEYVLEGESKVWLKCWTLGTEEVSHISRSGTTACQTLPYTDM